MLCQVRASGILLPKDATTSPYRFHDRRANKEIHDSLYLGPSDPYSFASTPRVLAFCQVIGLIGSRSRQKQTWCGHSRGQPWIGGKHCWHWCGIADKHHYTWPCHRLHMSGGFTETWKRLRSARKQSPTALGEPKILMAIPRLCGIQKHLAKSMKRWLNSHAPHWKSLGWCRDPYSFASTPRVLAFCQVIGLIGSRSRQKQTWCGHSRGQPWIGGKHCWHWCGIADKDHYTWPCHILDMSGGLGGGPIESHMALGQLKILMAIPRLCGIQKILPKQWTFGWIRIMQHAGFRWNNWATSKRQTANSTGIYGNLVDLRISSAWFFSDGKKMTIHLSVPTIRIHQPEFPWNKGISILSCHLRWRRVIAMIGPDLWWHIEFREPLSLPTWHGIFAGTATKICWNPTWRKFVWWFWITKSFKHHQKSLTILLLKRFRFLHVSKGVWFSNSICTTSAMSASIQIPESWTSEKRFTSRKTHMHFGPL